ncbi:hypothetical protein DFH27DRAFT_627264 [Peziza echinospora]|nr:hypothetical protein DFH27DRAFT_627264 [Peziza echinospora]
MPTPTRQSWGIYKHPSNMGTSGSMSSRVDSTTMHGPRSCSRAPSVPRFQQDTGASLAHQVDSGPMPVESEASVAQNRTLRRTVQPNPAAAQIKPGITRGTATNINIAHGQGTSSLGARIQETQPMRTRSGRDCKLFERSQGSVGNDEPESRSRASRRPGPLPVRSSQGPGPTSHDDPADSSETDSEDADSTSTGSSSAQADIASQQRTSTSRKNTKNSGVGDRNGQLMGTSNLTLSVADAYKQLQRAIENEMNHDHDICKDIKQRLQQTEAELDCQKSEFQEVKVHFRTLRGKYGKIKKDYEQMVNEAGRKTCRTKMEMELSQRLKEISSKNADLQKGNRELGVQKEAMEKEISSLRSTQQSYLEQISNLTNDLTRYSNLRMEPTRDDTFFETGFNNIFLSIQNWTLNHFNPKHATTRLADSLHEGGLRTMMANITPRWEFYLHNENSPFLQTIIMRCVVSHVLKPFLHGKFDILKNVRQLITKNNNQPPMNIDDLIRWRILTARMVQKDDEFTQKIHQELETISMQLDSELSIFASSHSTKRIGMLRDIIRQASDLAMICAQQPDVFHYDFEPPWVIDEASSSTGLRPADVAVDIAGPYFVSPLVHRVSLDSGNAVIVAKARAYLGHDDEE